MYDLLLKSIKVQYPMIFVMIACEFQQAKLDAFVLADEKAI